MLTIPFGAAYPGVVLGTLFLAFSLIDYGIAATAVNGNATLAPEYFAAELPIVGFIKKVLPLTMPMLIIKLVSEDLCGLPSGVTLSKVLGIIQLCTLGCILYTVNKILIPAIKAVVTDGITVDEAFDLHRACAIMLACNTTMFFTGATKIRLGAVEDEEPVGGEKPKKA